MKRLWSTVPCQMLTTSPRSKPRTIVPSRSSSTHSDTASVTVYHDDEFSHYLEHERKSTDTKSLKSPPMMARDKSRDSWQVVQAPLDDHSDRQRRSLGTIDQLANVLGSDNATHTTEVDTLPCSGIRIPHGPLSGLLGWKLVVRPAPAGKNGWWNETARARRTQHRRSAVLPSLLAASSQEQTLVAPMRPVNAARFSTLSLPLTVDDIEKPPLPPKHNTRNVSVDLTRRAHIRVSLDAKAQGSIPTRRSPSPLPANHRPPSAVVVNFVLDTGVQHSTISRDTLNLMGYSVDRLPLDEDEQPFITLLIQGLPSRFRLAAPGDMSRLGVQFLQDAGLSLYFPRDHRDGPVLYVEPERLSMDAPSTVPRQTPKMTIPQRVRALFGL